VFRAAFTTVVEGLGFTEGPVWRPEGSLAFTSITGGVYMLGPGGLAGGVPTGGGPTGLAAAADGALYVAQCSGVWDAPAERPAGIYRLDGEEVTPVATEGLSAPNDLCFGPDGRIWFTDPISPTALERPEPGRLFACDPANGALELIDDDLYFPNGLAFDADGGGLYVAETQAQRVVRYTYRHGGVSGRRIFCETPGGGDGMAVDRHGNVWLCVNVADAVVVFSPEGTLLGRLECGEGTYVSNCCFGGRDLRTLFVTAPGKGALLRVEPGVCGLPLIPFRDIARTPS